MGRWIRAFSIIALLSLTRCGCGDTGDIWQFASGVDVPWCGTGFLVQGDNSDFYEIDLPTGEYVITPDDYDGDINALGYNPLDHRLYGVATVEDRLDNTTLTMAIIDPSVRPIHVEIVTIDMPDEHESRVTSSFPVGDIDANGRMYISRDNIDGFAVVDVNPLSPTYLTVIDFPTFTGDGKPPKFADWVLNPQDNMLYTMHWRATVSGVTGNHNELWRINPQTGVTENLGVTTIPVGRVFGAGYGSSDGILYWGDNFNGEIWAVDVSDPANPNLDPTLTSTGPTSSKNDGARCPLVR